MLGLDTADSMASLIMAHLDEIRSAAVGIWKRHRFIREFLGSWEDAAQEGILYCLRYGTRYYTPQVSESHYLATLSRRGVWHAARRIKRRMGRGHAQVLYGETYETDSDLPANPIPYEDNLGLVEWQIDLASSFGILSDKEKLVVCWHYGLGCAPLDHREIGRRLGVSHWRVTQIHNEAVRRLRRNFRIDGEC